MKKGKFALIIIFLSMCIFDGMSQSTQSIDGLDELKKYDQLLVEKYPSFFDKKMVTKVYDIDENYSRIEYIDNGVLTEELVYKKGLTRIIVAKSVLITEENVPQIVKDAASEIAISEKSKIRYYEVSPSYGKPMIYAIDYKEGEKRKRKYFSKLGREVNPPK